MRITHRDLDTGAHHYTGEVTYDKYNNLATFKELVGANHTPHTTTFTHDKENRPTRTDYGNDRRVNFAYDGIGRIKTRTVKMGDTAFVTRYEYVKANVPDKPEFSATPLVETMDYGNESLTYTYDDAGNITSVSDGTNTVTYVYDMLGQLTRVNDPYDMTGGNNGTTWVYEYDFGGNIKSKKAYAYTANDAFGDVIATRDYAYSNAAWKDQLTVFNGVGITYDQIGNPLNDGTWSYVWAKGRQLQSMTKDGETVSFLYNENGLRVQKTATGTGTTNYILHGKNVVHLVNGNNELHFYYDAQNKPAIVEFNGVSYAYQYNLQGDVIALLDNAGNKVVEYRYDAWGKQIHKGGTLASTLGTLNPFRYRHYVYDEETENYYNQSRFYNPFIGRFTTSDATEVLIASTKSLTEKNLYAYCDNNPVMRKDSNGAFWDTFFDIVSLAVSVCEVIANPADPWAWAGLAGDVVDLVPFVTGVGEMTRAVKAANKVGDVLTIQKATDFSDEAVDLIRGLDRSSGFTKSTRSSGTQIHKGYKVDIPGKEFDEIKGIRLDYLDKDNKVIYELKPFNPWSVRQGIRQLEKYNQRLGGGYKMVLEVY